MRKFSSRELFTKDLTRLLECLHARGYGVTLGEGYRTKNQQLLYYEGYNVEIVTSELNASPPRQVLLKKGRKRSRVKVSQHQKRLAQDLHIWNAEDGKTYITETEWKAIGAIWCGMDKKNRWGGNFGLKKEEYYSNNKIGWDRWHFERRG